VPDLSTPAITDAAADPSLPADPSLAADARLIRRVRLRLIAWSGLSTLVVLLVLGSFWLARLAARSRYWRESAIELWRRRRTAIVVVAVFLLIALLDSIAWIGGGGEGVAAYQPRSIIDRIFQPDTFKEASYSAPFARVSFYGSQPLRHPGAHLFGTDILGRDVVYRALKGVRVALLIGVFTSLIVIPLALLLLTTFGALALSQRRPKASEVFLLIVTSFMAIRSVRHIPIFSLVAAPLLADQDRFFVERQFADCLAARLNDTALERNARLRTEELPQFSGKRSDRTFGRSTALLHNFARCRNDSID